MQTLSHSILTILLDTQTGLGMVVVMVDHIIQRNAASTVSLLLDFGCS